MKKILRNHVKAPATDKHPAQVEMYSEDVPIGKWTTRKLSTAYPASEVGTLLDRVDKAIAAVKMARERANGTVVKEASSEGILRFIFEGTV